MANLNMQGPFPFNSESINKNITKSSPGNYALGTANDQGLLSIKYIGRADKDVNERLHDWIGVKNHPQFKFSYAKSAKDAYLKECQNWHDFKPTENSIHPDKPDGTDWKCPTCDT